MRRYETVFILHPQIASESRKVLDDRIQKAIQSNGQVIQIQDWGVKNLAYPIKKQGKGSYCYVEYQGGAEVIESIERTLRYHEGVLRYLTVKVEEGELSSPQESEASQNEGGDVDVQI